MHQVDPGGIIRCVWEELQEPWQACAEQAWEAYRERSLPIGAVVTDATGASCAGGATAYTNTRARPRPSLATS